MEEKEKQEIIQEVAERVALSQKTVLTSQEASAYLGISLSKLYKLTCTKEIPHYKPNGKLNYFNRTELEAWAQSNRVPTVDEINTRKNIRPLLPDSYDVGSILDKLDGGDPAKRHLLWYLLEKPMLEVIDSVGRNYKEVQPSQMLRRFLGSNKIRVIEAIYICSTREEFIDSCEKTRLHIILNHLGLL